MAKHYILNGLTRNDLQDLEIATRLRWEAEEDQHEDVRDKKELVRWLKIHDKICQAIARVEGKQLDAHLKGCLCRLCEAKRIRGRHAKEEKPSPK